MIEIVEYGEVYDVEKDGKVIAVVIKGEQEGVVLGAIEKLFTDIKRRVYSG